MLIDYAILGLLTNHSLSGYDLKKIMLESSYLYWSGNNNQIYKALLQLDSLGYVTSETLHQEGLPSKKVYSITEAGKLALKEWLGSVQPELPEFRKPFLVQLACAAHAEPDRMSAMLLQYSEELQAQRIMGQEKYRRMTNGASRTPVERWLDRQMFENEDRFFEAEIQWARHAIKSIGQLAGTEEDT